MRVATLLLALGLPGLLPGQQVRGRVVGGDDHRPIARALIELRRPGGSVAVRAVTNPSGNFVVRLPGPGRYALRVAAIGFAPSRRDTLDISGDRTLPDLVLQPVVITLADLEVLGAAGRCGALGRGSDVLTRLLDGARTSLDVMAATLKESDGFRIESVHRVALATRGDSLITADTSRGMLVDWPVTAVDADTLRTVGFMNDRRDPINPGRIWYGPDVGILSADWFLGSHCFHIAADGKDSTTLVLAFEPARRGKQVDIAGTLELDRTTLALRRLTFEHRFLPGALRDGLAGGEIRFAPLPSGLWLPMSWRIYAPLQEDRTGRASGHDERAGHLLGVPGGPTSARDRDAPVRELVFTIPRELLTPPDSLTDTRRYTQAIAEGCPDLAGLGRGTLLSEDRGAGLRAARTDDAADWIALGCDRLLLDLDGAIARGGLRMASGESWLLGATRALLAALERDHTNHLAAELLAVAALDQGEPVEGRAVRDALARAVTGGVTAPAAVRGCATLSLRMGELAASNRCVIIGLEAGGDSTWGLLHLARLASRSADTATVSSLLDAAMAAARQPSDWAEVGWQLRWFLEPGEWDEWLKLPDSARDGFVRDAFARRDIRDGRRPGSRLVEHFQRLDYAMTHFLRDMPRKQRPRMAVAAVPEQNPIGGFVNSDSMMRFTSAPEEIAARSFRFYKPWSPILDDRGAVWLRFGKPDKTVFWKAAREGNYNTRAAWLYTLGDVRLVLQFEGELFDRTPEPTRLVAGVLGNYLCGLEQSRCNMVMRLSCMPPPPGSRCSADPNYSPIRPEQVEELRRSDQSLITVATTTDDNRVRVEHPIHMVAELARVWDPASRAPLAVIPYALRAEDLALDGDSGAKTATVTLRFRQWSRSRATWLSTDVTRRVRFDDQPEKRDWLTGFVVIPSTADVSAWSLVAVGDSTHRGTVSGASPAPGATPGLQLSDVVLGAASQGQAWPTTTGGKVPLAPLGTFDRGEPVSVYWQVRSGSARDSMQVSLAVYRVGRRGEDPVLTVGFLGRVDAGLHEMQREIGIDRLDKGEYRLELTVTDRAAGESATRSARLLVR